MVFYVKLPNLCCGYIPMDSFSWDNQYTDFGTLNPRRFALDTDSASENVHILLMGEIRHHLGCVKPRREWD